MVKRLFFIFTLLAALVNTQTDSESSTIDMNSSTMDSSTVMGTTDYNFPVVGVNGSYLSCNQITLRTYCRQLYCIFQNRAAPDIDIVRTGGRDLYDTLSGPSSAYVTYDLLGLTGAYNGADLKYVVWALSGNETGQVLQIAFSYDFTGDGTFDRQEIFPYHALDPARGFMKCVSGTPSISGSGYKDFNGGKIRMTIWLASGRGQVILRTDSIYGGQLSFATIPYNVVKWAGLTDPCVAVDKSEVVATKSAATQITSTALVMSFIYYVLLR